MYVFFIGRPIPFLGREHWYINLALDKLQTFLMILMTIVMLYTSFQSGEKEIRNLSRSVEKTCFQEETEDSLSSVR